VELVGHQIQDLITAVENPVVGTRWKAGLSSLDILVFSTSELSQHPETVRHRLPEMAQE